MDPDKETRDGPAQEYQALKQKSSLVNKGRGSKKAKHAQKLGDIDQEKFDYDNNNSEYVKSVEGWVVFVSNLHNETEKSDLKKHFEEYGRIIELKLPLSRETGAIRGYALIEFRDFESAKSAVENENGTEINDMPIKVSMAFRGRPLERE
ncbi:hypothetical protein MHBO_002542 [Bonamia ostreae]|uniref:RRM domain-containing protein n=1 Tax=Bonamia ostreae TaxID=126728 RepID=A0ABV2AMP8_9EUKA